MRPGSKTVLWAVLVLLALGVVPALADEVMETLVSKVIDSFDDPAKSVWMVQGSRFGASGFPQLGFVKDWPEALYGNNQENLTLNALGVHGSFNRKAYNYIEIIPAKKGSGGAMEPSPIDLPGRIETIDVWVWGGNFRYWLDVHLRDYQGVDHVLTLGDLNYPGWRDLGVTIPASIPQAQRYLPTLQGLQLTKLVLWTRPEEKVDDFYVFFDELKVLTDLFEERFDGEELANPQTLQKLWTGAKY